MNRFMILPLQETNKKLTQKHQEYIIWRQMSSIFFQISVVDWTQDS